MRLVRAHFRPNQPQPPAHPVNMRIHRHRRHPQRKAQYDPRRLGPNARQLPQPRPGLRHRHLPQKRQIQRPLVQLQYPVQRRLDPRRLYLCQPPAGNCRLYLLNPGPRHRLQRPEPRHQTPKSPLRIAVGGMLRQDSEHQLMGRLQTRLISKRPIFLRQQPDSVRYGHPRPVGPARPVAPARPAPFCNSLRRHRKYRLLSIASVSAAS